jgi:hypothetical protein
LTGVNQVAGILRHQDVISQEQAKYGRSMLTTTFVPKLGMVLKGDHSNGYFGMPDASMYYANQAVAQMSLQVPKISPDHNNMYAAAKNDTNSDYKRFYFGAVEARRPKVEYVASIKKQLYLEAKARQAQTQFINNGGQLPNAQGLPPYLMAQMYAQQMNPYQQQYQASVPPGGNDSAAQVVGPLTQIPFIQDVLGFPTPEYWINNLTTKVALPQLHAEQPETDWGTPNLQLEPTQFVEQRRPDFDSHFFLAKRNEFAFIIPREYRYRATIDPYNIYVRQASDGLRQAREALTLLALSGLPNQNTQGFNPSGSDVPDPTENAATGGYPAAENNSKSFYEGLFANYWDSTRLQIDSVVMHPVDFVNYESNFYTNGWQGYQDVSDWGLIQFPGFKRPIRTAISPFVPRNIAYFFNSRFVFTGEGPMVTESWAKPEANSDAGAYRDYVDVRIFNPKRAGFKATILGGTPGNEVTTLKEARELIVPPTDLLEKNQTSL